MYVLVSVCSLQLCVSLFQYVCVFVYHYVFFVVSFLVCIINPLILRRVSSYRWLLQVELVTPGGRAT